MVYYSTYKTEGIVFHSKEDIDDFYIISLTKHPDGKTFRVELDFDNDWYWDFEMYHGAYEMIKHMIMDVAFECESEDELIMELDAMFEDNFRELVVDDECDCEHGCKHCGCKE